MLMIGSITVKDDLMIYLLLSAALAAGQNPPEAPEPWPLMAQLQGTAHAECGRFEEAVRYAEQAVELAVSESQKANLRSRLELYRAGRPS
jgi:hypothetical protein